MDQSLTYVKDQLAQGKTKDQIRMALLGGGWQLAQIEALFSKQEDLQAQSNPIPVTALPLEPKPVQPVAAPIVQPIVQPVIKPLTDVSKPVMLSADVKAIEPIIPAVIAPSSQTAVVDVKPPEVKSTIQTDKPKKSSIWKLIGWTAITIAIAVAGLLGAAYYIGQKNKSTTTTNTVTTPASTTLTYKSNGLTFTYPVGWKKTNINALLGTVATPAVGLQDLFFTSANYTTIQQSAIQVDTTDLTKVVSFTTTAGSLASLSTAYITNASSCPTVTSTTPGVTVTTPTCTPPSSDITAKNQAINVLKTTYAADGTPTVNTTVAVDQTKINTVVTDTVTCYWVTNGPATKPYLVLSVPVSAGALTISFPGATSLDALTGDLLAIYTSIKVQQL